MLVTALLMGCSSEDIGENLLYNGVEGQENQGVVKPSSSIKGEMKVHFIDVGQGDATLIQTPNNKTILIDAGDRDKGTSVVEYIKTQSIYTIDVLIATHPHADHIGGIPHVINSFNIGEVYMPKVPHTTKTYEDLLLAIQNKGLKIKTAKAGVTLDIDSSIEAVMMAPNSEKYESLNDYSTVLKVVYEDSSFIITGDAEESSEKEMLAKGHDLKADVLRVSHHGSRSSTIQPFLNEVNPKYGIISVGTNNRYGHPHDEAVARLSRAGVDIYRTDIHGHILITTDGQSYNIHLEKKGWSNPNPNPNPTPNTNQTDSSVAVPKSIPTEKIDINTASLEELQHIIHIGHEYAEQIINLRPFKTIDELTKVKGIGDSRLRDIIEEGKAFVEEGGEK